MKIEQLQQAKVAIWGYGIEGQASCEYLQAKCPALHLTVLCPADEVVHNTPVNAGLSFNHHQVDARLLSQYDVVIKSPGITPYQSIVTEASCVLISSSSLWFSNERDKQPGSVIAVTGTKGKSTSCAMLQHVLIAMGYEVVLAGNFGVPLIQCLQPCDYLILETSSYQAQDGVIAADIAVLLNLYAEHLDWHGSESQYHQDKWQLLKQAQSVVLNAKDQNSLELLKAEPVSTAISYFETEQGFYELQGVLMYQDKALLSEYGWQLKGAHNLSNAAAVCAVITFLGLDIKQCMNALKQFKSLPHRIQVVKKVKGVTYINDSIASTPHATWAALNTVERSHTILLVGGFDRGVDWLWWIEKIADDPPKMIICSGENGEKIYQLILNHQIKTQCIYTERLKLAVQSAIKSAEAGDTVLLSPGAPSFDAFENYQQRGQKFIQWLD